MTVRTVTPEDWPNIEALFGERGACGGCWCMWWRVPHGGKLWESVKGARNRASLRKLTLAGQLHAVMAYEGAEPAGWCCFGPRADFPRVETVRAIRPQAWSAGTWAVVCFFIPAKWRKRGVAGMLLEAATRRAFELGAEEVQAYPAVPKKGELPAAFAYTGVPRLFEAAGFAEARREGSRAVWVKRRA